MSKNFGAVTVEEKNGVAILTWRGGENRFNPDSIKNLNAALDYVEKSEATALITTGDGKFYSNGLDLTWMLANTALVMEFIKTFLHFLKKLLIFPIPTIAAMNGHAYAGGLMMCLAHDYRVMRADRGFICLPEVDINIPLAPGMNALINAKITDASIYREAILTGKKYGGKEAVATKIVDFAVSENELLPKALEIAGKTGGKNRATYTALKQEMFNRAVALLDLGSIGLGTIAFSKL